MNRTKQIKGGNPKLVRHLEQHLGPMDGGWRMRSAGDPLFIVKFIDQPNYGADTFMTLGLSDRILQQGGGPPIRQELLFSASPTENDDEQTVALVMAVAAEILETGTALHRGQVLGPSGPILDGVTAEALYCTHPVYFPDEFGSIRDQNPPILFVWLVPILKNEAAFVRQQGAEMFESLLEEQNPELHDLNRESMRLP